MNGEKAGVSDESLEVEKMVCERGWSMWMKYICGQRTTELIIVLRKVTIGMA